MNLKDKYGDWALITGASSGIGKEFSYKFASEGINLVLVARREELLKEIQAELETNFEIKVIVIPLDLTKENISEFISEATNNINISILVNNAGSGFLGNFIDGTNDEYLKLLKLNCIAPVLLTKWFLEKNSSNKKGAIIFVGSVVGILPSSKMSVYSASKAFINTLGESLWNELNRSDIDVLTVQPGSTDTEFTRISKGKSFNLRSTKNVVDTSIKYLGNAPSIIDGLLNRFVFATFRILPRKFILNLTQRISQKYFKP